MRRGLTRDHLRSRSLQNPNHLHVATFPDRRRLLSHASGVCLAVMEQLQLGLVIVARQNMYSG